MDALLYDLRDADQLVTVTSRQPQGGVNQGGLSYVDFTDYQEQSSDAHRHGGG